MRPRLLGAILLLGVLVGGCGAGTGGETDPPADRRAPAADIAIIRGWGLDMQRGDLQRASERFAAPAVVANNTPELRLRTRAEVAAFHSSLPCGARLVDAEPHQGAIIATFELTERPGASCGAGTGQRGVVAFTLRDGKIVRWIRVQDGPATQEPEGEFVKLGSGVVNAPPPLL